jgi:hypothetical protein
MYVNGGYVIITVSIYKSSMAMEGTFLTKEF